VTAEVLRRKGGRYAEWAKDLEGKYHPDASSSAKTNYLFSVQALQFEFATVAVVPGFLGMGKQLTIRQPIDGRAWQDQDCPEDSLKVIRGGSWITLPKYCRSAYRSSQNAQNRNPYTGFRVVISTI
jgi:Sulfatase-modifying factor enzyme 1